MWVLNIFVTLLISALGIANGSTPQPPHIQPTPTLPTDILPQLNINKTKSECTTEQSELIKVHWLEVKRCFRGVVNQYLQHGVEENCNNLAGFKNATKKLLNTTQCLKRQNEINETSNLFYNLLNFTISGNSFKDFVKSNGSVCFSTSQTAIKNCITRENVRNHTTFDFRYWAALNLGTTIGCDAGRSLKKCVDQALQNSTAHCNNDHVKFFDSLSDFVYNTTCNKNGNHGSSRRTNASESGAAIGAANSFYSTTSVVMLLSLVFLLFNVTKY